MAKDKKVVGGTHTLHTTGVFGVSKKKNVEYFGGDSTVTQAGKERSSSILFTLFHENSSSRLFLSIHVINGFSIFFFLYDLPLGLLYLSLLFLLNLWRY